MHRRPPLPRSLLSCLLLITAGLAGAAAAAPAAAAKQDPVTTFVSGIPGFRVFTNPGELNPEALARVSLNDSTGEMCLALRTVEVAMPMTVHLHSENSDGRVIATFFDGTTDPNAQRCLDVGAATARDILANGFDYALDIHSDGIPGGGTITGAVTPGAPGDAFLTSEAVTPGPGDPDGTGILSFVGFEKSGEVFLFVNTEGLTPPLTIDLHRRQQDGSNGPVVANLVTNATHDDPSRDFFLSRSLVRDVNRSPGNYYVLVHSSDFPAGALRGQLER
jgi:hypothetical protein